MPRLPALAVFAASVALAAAVPAQSLVANLNTGNVNNGASGTGPFYVVGGQAVFATSPAGQFGSEVYVSRGSWIAAFVFLTTVSIYTMGVFTMALSAYMYSILLSSIVLLLLPQQARP